MQTIYLQEPTAAKKLTLPAVVLAVGFFDGVHLGHQAVIKTAASLAKKHHLKLAVMTFDRHAQAIFGNKSPRQLRYLTTLGDKLQLFSQLGADISYVLTFDEAMAKQAPQQFVDRYMVGLNAKIVVAGQDYTYGKAELANMHTLPLHANGRFEVVAVAQKQAADQKISSTRIRTALADGEISVANRLLGRTFANHGYVVHGFARGRQLGFPTLNVAGLSAQRLPAVGVYATRVKIEGDEQIYQAMTSIGYNETFGDDLAKTVEINVFDYHKDTYGKRVRVFWDQFLRPMVKFDGIDALVEQLHEDKAKTKAFYQTAKLSSLTL